jgi:transposase
MNHSTVGQFRRVTDAQIEIILNWNRNRRTIDDWARILGVSRATIDSCLKAWSSPEQWEAAHSRRVGTGRRRILSVAEMEPLLQWYRTRKTRRQLARELGLSDNTVCKVIKQGGQYKRGTAEQRDAHRDARRERLDGFEPLRVDGPSTEMQNALRRLRAENAARFRAHLGISNT